MVTRKWRPFGSTFHMAALTHFCDRCMQQIEPGDRYERFVELRLDKIVVYKYHNVPDCPPNSFDEEDAADITQTPKLLLAA